MQKLKYIFLSLFLLTSFSGCQTIKNKSDAIYYCLNNKCITKIKRSIEYFVSKNAMDVEGLGPSIIEKLVSNKIINNLINLNKYEFRLLSDKINTDV